MDKHAIVHYSIHKRIILDHARKFQCTGKYNFLFLGATNYLYSIHKRNILDPVKTNILYIFAFDLRRMYFVECNFHENPFSTILRLSKIINYYQTFCNFSNSFAINHLR